MWQKFFIDPELKAQYEGLIQEEQNVLGKIHMSDALWNELWRGYFDFCAKTLGLAPEDAEDEGKYCF